MRALRSPQVPVGRIPQPALGSLQALVRCTQQRRSAVTAGACGVLLLRVLCHLGLQASVEEANSLRIQPGEDLF